MSHSPEIPNQLPSDGNGHLRCPVCDSVIEPGEDRCLMCGAALEDKVPDVADITAKSDQSAAEDPKAEDDGRPTVLEMTMIEQQSPLTLWKSRAR